MMLISTAFLLLAVFFSFLLAVETHPSAGCESKYPTPSFLKWQHLLPEVKITNDLSYPLGSYHLTYAGLGMWNSRGIDLHRAIAAMLGDPYQYYESPLFTLYKLIHMNRTNDIRQLVYPSAPPFTGHSFDGQIAQFLNQVVAAEQKRIQVPEVLNEKEAVCRARELMDERFAMMSDQDITQKFLRGGGYSEDPWDAIFSISYVGVDPYYYGPNLLVLDKDVEQRGIDLNLYQKKFLCGGKYDTGEILTYGYKKPSMIKGFELRSSRPVENIAEKHPLRIAFYKASINQQPVVLIVSTRNSSNFVYCVHPTTDNTFKVCDNNVGIQIKLGNPKLGLRPDKNCGLLFPIVREEDLDVIGIIVSIPTMDGDQ
ncbi:hypothetical protein BKA69DRAFT_1179392, partial [Paraphysoderma sedebokerense]